MVSFCLFACSKITLDSFLMVGGVAGTGGVMGQTGIVAGSQKTVDHI